jgi:acyl transferase domain-containing protein/3-hydroxymyristoyl/3-hydroxydecanoyl-(acyl carrier protein) dehydratase
MKFTPIAIVGQGCALPGALDPQELWEAVVQGRNLLTHADEGAWRAPKAQVLHTTNPTNAPGANAPPPDKAWHDIGGYVRGFEERFDPEGFLTPAELIRQLSPLFQWVLHTGRETWRAARFRGDPARAGVILGNLSYPTEAIGDICHHILLEDLRGDGGAILKADDATPRPHMLNRFMSGYPASLLAQSLGLGGRSFCLDAACASSLYAIKLACDALQRGEADLMLAGGVNAISDLFLHVGFTSLLALSRSGRSRPFHRHADGLVPALGAAVVALRRLEDAVADGDQILGVIRGVGLSNDGNKGGFLSPSEEAQVRAMEQAYRMAGLSPREISLIECHATGTAIGDAVEVASLSRVFAGCDAVPIGSLKSNLGHLTSAAGVAGLLKVLGAFKAGVRPPSIGADEPLPQIASSPMRLLREAEAWDCAGPRRAAVSAFGFGGNNAHLIVEEYRPDAGNVRQAAKSGGLSDIDPVAIVGVGILAADIVGSAAFTKAWLSGQSSIRRRTHEQEATGFTEEIDLDCLATGFPPHDLAETHPQQLMIMAAAAEALRGAKRPALDKISVFIGMGTDTETSRYNLRLQIPTLIKDWAENAALNTVMDAVCPPLNAVRTVGCMPNIPANRLNVQYNFQGPSLTFSAEELSGIVALEAACAALRSGEIDAALVGAVDLSAEPCHQQAARACLPDDRHVAGDAAVALMLKRLRDAEQDGDTVFAVVSTTSLPESAKMFSKEPPHWQLDIEDFPLIRKEADATSGSNGEQWAIPNSQSPITEGGFSNFLLENQLEETAEDLRLGFGNGRLNLTAQFGHAHAASGLLHVAAGALALRHRSLPDANEPRPWLPSTERRRVNIELNAMGGQTASIRLSEAPQREPVSFLAQPVPRIYLFSGADRRETLRRLQENRQADDAGPARLAIVAASPEEFERKREQALRRLANEGDDFSQIALLKGIYYADQPIRGEVAFTFPSSAGAYRGMGRELSLAFPELLDLFLARVRRAESVREAAQWIYDPAFSAPGPTAAGEDAIPVFDKLKGALYLAQLHAILSQEVLGVRPDACIGFSAGETAALFAVGAWTEIDEYYDEIAASGAWTRHLAQDLAALEEAWSRFPDANRSWRNWAVNAPIEEALRALAEEPLAHLATINAPGACSIAGQAEACERVVERLGRSRCQPLNYDLIHHCPEMIAYREPWKRLNTRKTAPLKIRFYTGADPTISFYPNQDQVAWALAGMSERTVDYPRMIQKAWEDGVRIFIEHGPRSSCSSYINQILAGREHLAVSLDSHGASDVRQVCEAVAQLYVAGARADHRALTERLARAENTELTGAAPATATPARAMRRAFPAHQAPIQLPDLRPTPTATTAQVMEPAPRLPSALALYVKEKGKRRKASATTETAPQTFPPPPQSASAHGPAYSSAVTGIGEYVSRLSEAHQEFVQLQTEAHAEFLRVRQNALQALIFASQRFSVHCPEKTENAALNVRQSSRPGSLSLTFAEDDFQSPRQAARSGGLSDISGNATVERQVSQNGAKETPRPIGPTFDREQLLIHASGKISEIFGPLFAQQDQYAVQVRMPEPPLLLADRVTGIDALAGSMKLGAVWTETDVRADSWFLHQGRILPGLMIEAGQADLFLISYLGIDFKNRGERAYRLLGCEATYMAPLPRPGDTLCFDIHIDAHAAAHASIGQKHLFFFHYDCHVNGQLALRVRNGQAGFFTPQELAESKGVLWSPEATQLDDAQPEASRRIDPPRVICQRSGFDKKQLAAFAAGRLSECFGYGYELAETHTRTPAIPAGKMLLLDEVTHYQPQGGPWKRGYLRASRRMSPDDWFFAGHFKNDPCMPGTLMTEMAFQGMSVYLTALGYTLDKDGWTFAPVPGEKCKLVCRGQATPSSKELSLEIFVREVVAGPIPTLIADVLGTVDGLKALHAERLSLHLTPDFPNLSRRSDPSALSSNSSARPVAPMVAPIVTPIVTRIGDIPCDERQALDCAWGSPSEAFGEAFAAFDSGRRIARLPGPPYLFLSRITKIDAQYLGMKKGGKLTAEWDILPGNIFFQENGQSTLPFCVIQEAALQPCGWLSVYMGCPLAYDRELAFRNLDGTLELYEECFPQSGTLRTVVENTSIADAGGTIILSFRVEAYLGERQVLKMNTVFGYFAAEALANQQGLPMRAGERDALNEASEFSVDLTARPARYCGDRLRLAGPQSLMVDRISGYWPQGGGAGLGLVRGEKRARHDDWFFKAHFFQDPVQPGSLGIEAMLQVLQFYMLHNDMGAGIETPRFEPLALRTPITWRYRGQVTPDNNLIQTIVEITETGRDERGAYAIAKATLWRDGLKIYEASNIGMRIVTATDGRVPRLHSADTEAPK